MRYPLPTTNSSSTPTSNSLTLADSSATTSRARTSTDVLAARIAANQVDELAELALIGYPTAFDDQTRAVVETSLRLTARRLLEGE